MKLSNGTLLSDNFISKIVFLSPVYPVEHELNKTEEKEWYFTIGYKNINGELRAFKLKFDNEDEVKQSREEIIEEVMKYE